MPCGAPARSNCENSLSTYSHQETDIFTPSTPRLHAHTPVSLPDHHGGTRQRSLIEDQNRLGIGMCGIRRAAVGAVWASLLEVATTPLAEGSSFSVNGFVSALTNAVSAVAGAQLAASSFGL